MVLSECCSQMVLSVYMDRGSILIEGSVAKEKASSNLFYAGIVYLGTMVLSALCYWHGKRVQNDVEFDAGMIRLNQRYND